MLAASYDEDTLFIDIDDLMDYDIDIDEKLEPIHL